MHIQEGFVCALQKQFTSKHVGFLNMTCYVKSYYYKYVICNLQNYITCSPNTNIPSYLLDIVRKLCPITEGLIHTTLLEALV